MLFDFYEIKDYVKNFKSIVDQIILIKRKYREENVQYDHLSPDLRGKSQIQVKSKS